MSGAAAPAARFAADLAALTQGGTGGCDDIVLVAVSGGPDSLALLLLAHEALGARCVAATVDHGLRAAAADEAAVVAGICAARGIAHATLAAPLPDRAGRTANVSARARLLRYRLLEAEADRVGARWIATAHHADDQAETLLMRLGRGAGVAGLAGIRARGGRIVRPLLGWRRSDLAAIVVGAGLTAVDDPSNRDDRYARTRIRNALAAADWIAPAQLAASARALGDAEDALAWMAADLAAGHVRLEDGAATLWPHPLPFELRRRLVERCLRHVQPALDPDGAALVRAVRTLEAGARAMLGNVLIDPQPDDGWRFTLAPRRR